MLNKNELLFVVDEKNQPVEPKPRQEVHDQGFWHRTTHIWIYNSNKQVLCQKRSEKKDSSPGLWEPFFGGHTPSSKESLVSATEEVKEELGLAISTKDLVELTIFKNEDAKEFEYIYLLEWDGDRKSVQLEKDEVDQIQWFSLSYLKQKILEESDPIWNRLGYEEIVLNHLEKQP